MKTIKILLISLIYINFTNAQQLKLNTKSSTITWIGKSAVGAYNVRGTLKPSKGLISLDQDSIMKIEMKIDMKSLDSKYPKLTRHLKSKDFFDVKKFESSRFLMSVPVKIIDNQISITGEFEIKAKRRKEQLKLNFERQKDKVILSGTLILDRTTYGIIYNSESYFDNLKDQAIADLFQVNLYLEFIID